MHAYTTTNLKISVAFQMVHHIKNVFITYNMNVTKFHNLCLKHFLIQSILNELNTKFRSGLQVRKKLQCD